MAENPLKYKMLKSIRLTYESNMYLFQHFNDIIDTASQLKHHYRLHAMSVWLNLIPRLHRAGADNSFPQHNKFRGHDDPALFKGVVRPITFSHGYQVNCTHMWRKLN